jgi:hypothetical protein
VRHTIASGPRGADGVHLQDVNGDGRRDVTTASEQAGDSTQFSTLVTELAESYVGTALTVQMALGFLLTGTTIWLVPAVEQAAWWHWAFAVLAVGPLAGIVAMRRLIGARA